MRTASLGFTCPEICTAPAEQPSNGKVEMKDAIGIAIATLIAKGTANVLLMLLMPMPLLSPVPLYRRCYRQRYFYDHCYGCCCC